MPFNFEKAPDDEECECMPSPGMSDEEFAGFCKTPEYIRRLPLGVIEYRDGFTLYIDGAGYQWTRKGFKARFGYDPKPVYDRMRRQNII